LVDSQLSPLLIVRRVLHEHLDILHRRLLAVASPSRQVSIGRERPNRRDITVWRRHDANDALRSGADHAGSLDEVVLA
jgi:hypothetical protein